MPEILTSWKRTKPDGYNAELTLYDDQTANIGEQLNPRDNAGSTGTWEEVLDDSSQLGHLIRKTVGKEVLAEARALIHTHRKP